MFKRKQTEQEASSIAKALLATLNQRNITLIDKTLIVCHPLEFTALGEERPYLIKGHRWSSVARSTSALERSLPADP